SLTEYVTQHFSDEEDLMHEMGYPILGPRRSLHEQLTGDTKRYMAAYFNGQQVAASELGPFLTTWLRTHIEHEDMRFATWLQQREEA
ncbi:MAG: hemerythrin family protein, partial [Actinomycetia bacterium]|nr:hemerythrin family protein [Actinomycetes bacterium]